MKKFKFRIESNKRGFSIVEAIVAMAVILVVSAAAITCVENFSKSSAVLNSKNEAIVVAEDALEIFKASRTYEEYCNLWSIYLGRYYTKSYGLGVVSGSVDDFPVGGSKVWIRVNFNTNNGVAVFESTVKDNKGQTIMHIKNYEKGIPLPTEEPTTEPTQEPQEP